MPSPSHDSASPSKLADIGLVGLAVMGQNLVLNMHDHGFCVAVYNRTESKTEDFLQGPAKGTNIIGTKSLQELFSKLKRPRRVLLMVQAGAPVDALIAQCLPYMEKGDILLDGGNSLFSDTERRCQELAKHGMLYVGMGVSGGEEGARHGPSIMPGGDAQAWESVRPILQAIAAKVEDGTPCCDWVGKGGAGHYVKMVHNGIEYGDMQLICEAYALMKDQGLTTDEMSEVFAKWNKGPLNSYLIEITAHILKTKDQDGKPLVDKILDVAGQKGTGKWTCIEALHLGLPLTLIAEAVFARCLSARKEERVMASKVLPGPSVTPPDPAKRAEFISALADALYASKMISYAQGFMLFKDASEAHDWQLNFGAIALMWRGGCIIRSQFLNKIYDAYKRNPKLTNLLLDPFFIDVMKQAQKGWRMILALAVQRGIAAPSLGAALSFYDGYRTATLPTGLLQAQRDYFGAHQYERIDSPRGQFFHTDWTGKGGAAYSSTYTV